MVSHLSPQFLLFVALTVGLAMGLTTTFVALIKPLVNAKIDPVTKKPKQTAVLQATALVAGIGFMLGLTAVFFHPFTLQTGAASGLLGFAVGLAAMGHYGVLTALLAAYSGKPFPLPLEIPSIPLSEQAPTEQEQSSPPAPPPPATPPSGVPAAPVEAAPVQSPPQ